MLSIAQQRPMTTWRIGVPDANALSKSASTAANQAGIPRLASPCRLSAGSGVKYGSIGGQVNIANPNRRHCYQS